ncbi:2-C-methyl-D-erythritol 2,4-cyclodiphosphate synthase [Halothermothrix orenii]|uniref:2-C-methyl-D-erythritol 2,4-cyclodiphosphate synthase n=1 Tax=Halothermothrix orenii (strain H 168 / OCM 544 / DSM 9562) TaxID=373903 RepID=ISPF_HALOH|nr:2-C-methyl-D-erythritol 2,4-cyclodiphosphate synthase [Halothermothrix orenii]B8D0A0.1 RecName: Full=2-C-methyl-D-erythritol 2,4-cyclodiphosphate synthase; Short=MECDP-synthase; Short=MECPP-synthase; Short=MECPS [Halothermothrix orenii H 168]ACL68854.1 2C-methyl-D-erythritol 2,4-cyclodiphosphate synthase [Halothermothrix orenii H 168]
MRIGIGFDVHPLKKGETLILGGVHIQGEYGLAGHSDADVLTHALMDAILGAMGEADIGYHFPDTDPSYRGISSLKLLKKVYNMMKPRGFSIGNIDLIIMAQSPKLSPYYNKIKENYTRILQLDSSRINIKATTTENLGFVGREEGIAAQAAVLLIDTKEGDINAG